MFVRKETTELKIVVGATMVLPSGFSGKAGWLESTTNPKTNITRLKSIRAMAYCFQFCAPVLQRLSSQRRNAGARYLPSMIQAK